VQTPQRIMMVALVATILVIVIGVAIAQTRKRKAVVESIRLAAESLGLGYLAKADKAFVQAWSAIKPLYKRGSAACVVFGDIDPGLRLTAFEHSYVVSTGKSAHRICHSVFAVDTPAWPTVTLERRGAAAKWFRRVLGRAEPPGAGETEAFSETWRITGDQAFAQTLLTDRVRSAIAEPQWAASWWFIGGKLALIGKHTLTEERLRTAVASLARVWDALPAELRHADPGAHEDQLTGSAT